MTRGNNVRGSEEPADRSGPMMRAARLHRRSEPLTIDIVPRPVPRPNDVLVQVHACGIVPNLQNVLQYPDDFIAVQPPKPAIFGLDVAGVIAQKGELVHGLEVGDRVYVNPARYCGTCRLCRTGREFACPSFTLNGYFGLGTNSAQMFRDYPYGGYAEYMIAPGYSLVKLDDSISYASAARWGYLGTAYGALRRAGVDTFSTVLVNGASGTLGLGAVLFALALGAPKVLGVGRDPDLLARVKAIDPRRIEVHATRDPGTVAAWAHDRTDRIGADVVLDALPPEAPVTAFEAGIDALAKFGRHVNCGGILQRASFDTPRLMVSSQTLMGSNWFTTVQGHEMVELARAGRLDLDLFETKIFALENINTAINAIDHRHGGFSNFVVSPQAQGAQG